MRIIIKLTAIILTAAVFVTGTGTTGEAKAKIRLNKSSIRLEEGKSVVLKVNGTKKKVKWSTKDKKTATVNVKGKVTAKKKGKTVICAKVAKKNLKCKVTVISKKNVQTPNPIQTQQTPQATQATQTPQATKMPLTENWTADSAAALKLRSYVSKVTNENNKADYIPKKERIAVFDMDGTLMCETYYTYYDTMMFVEYCLKDYPDKVSEELKNAAAEIAPGYVATEELARNFAKAYAGMTVQEFYNYAVEFGKKQTVSFSNMRYIDGFYLPMVELVRYLYENDFTIYVISGTERTTTRAIIANSPIKDYVTPDHVIGTDFEVKQRGHETEASNMDYKYVNGDELVLTGGFVQKNLNANKSIYIEREIGQRPVLAFGNSGSDTSMMNYAIDKRNPYPAEAYMIVADDNTREWGTQDWVKKSADYSAQGYTPVSMKNEFARIYPDMISRAAVQYSR